jgi:HlyD family secretion protein
MARRGKWAAMTLSLLAILAVASLVIASRHSLSAAQAAADAAPPAPGPTTAQVEKRALAQTLSVRGVITAPTAVTVTAPAGSAAGERLIVTGLPAQAGSTLTSPASVAEVAGRPVIALQSTGAFYRDLAFGDTGNDVGGLQAALGVKQSGTFDQATQSALAAVYKKLGYTVPTNKPTGSEATDAQTDSVQSLQDAVDDAQSDGAAAVRSAQAALDDAKTQQGSGTGSAGAVQQAQLTLDDAKASLAKNVARAQRNLNDETARVARQKLVQGPRFSADEVIAVPFRSTTVISVDTAVGAQLQGGQKIVTLGDPTLQAITYVGAAESQALRSGMPVRVTGDTLSSPLTGTISAVATAPESVPAQSSDSAAVSAGSAPTADRPFRVAVSLDQQPASTTVGAGVLLTVTEQGTDSEVVAVPAVALQEVDGDEVVVTLPDGKRWKVETGLTAQGWVEVRSGAPPVGSTVETR